MGDYEPLWATAMRNKYRTPMDAFKRIRALEAELAKARRRPCKVCGTRADAPGIESLGPLESVTIDKLSREERGFVAPPIETIRECPGINGCGKSREHTHHGMRYRGRRR